MVKNMKKIIVLSVFISIGIILMSSLVSAVEYRTVIEQNKQIISQETNDLIPTMKNFNGHNLALLVLRFIRLIFSVMRANGIPVTIILLRLILPILLNQHVIIRVILSMMRNIGRVFGVILVTILKIIRLPFRFISKSITLLIQLIRVIILSPILRIVWNHFPITNITERFHRVTS